MKPQQPPLLTSYTMGALTLPNRVVMAAMTRARATNAELTPTPLMATYYAQRASAGLILTESAWVSQRAVGFLNIPGIYSPEQVSGWKTVTESVHQAGGRIFLQLVHSGAVSHPVYLNGELPLGPSAINPNEQVYTPTGFEETMTPQAYTLDQIRATVEEFTLAAQNALAAGFDGLELHAQLFTLLPQFMSPATNQRTDDYGGSIENRCRLLFTILDAVLEAFPNRRVGIKFTPAAFNRGTIQPDESTIPTFAYILDRLNTYELAFVEIVGPRLDLSGTPLADWQADFFGWFRAQYNGTLMANLGFGFETGNQLIASGKADLVSFALPFVANPDLVARYRHGWPLATADPGTFYAGNERGYTDYTTFQA
ncbi:alkene reductase [Spirosoma pomorum]